MDMGQKINNLRTQNGLTLEELGNMVGVGKSTVRKWENGMIANMRRDKIAKLADALKTTPAYLMGWDEPVASVKNIFPIELKPFPVLGSVACGKPRFANEERESYVLSGSGIKADFCLIASGDSMINARIHDGDIIFIRLQDMVENGEIAAVVIDDEATLKRVYYYQEKALLILKPENPKYEDLIYSGSELEDVHILGKAVAFQSDVI